jgi:ADP-heptose:LPS heptosyltransferase
LQAILQKQYSAARYGDADGFQQRYQHVPQCMNSFLRPIKTPDDFVWFTKTGMF